MNENFMVKSIAMREIITTTNVTVDDILSTTQVSIDIVGLVVDIKEALDNEKERDEINTLFQNFRKTRDDVYKVANLYGKGVFSQRALEEVGGLYVDMHDLTMEMDIARSEKYSRLGYLLNGFMYMLEYIKLGYFDGEKVLQTIALFRENGFKTRPDRTPESVYETILYYDELWHKGGDNLSSYLYFDYDRSN